MTKIILTLTSLLLLSGCALFDRKVKILNEVQEVQIPLLYCPAPLETHRPILQIHQLSDIELASDGELVKAYTASIIQLQGYAADLEASLNTYNEANKAYEELRLEFQRKLSEESQNSTPTE